MHRRGNKSKRVPNVKLRPAPVDALKIKAKEQCWAEDSQAGSDDTTIEDRCPRPFKSFVICATGVKDKPTLFKKAAELGASCIANFTDRVTHLVAESHGGPKYACALERKIPIMQPSWIEKSHETWLHGDDVDIEKSLIIHRLPVFSGVVLCPSGITDLERRMQINKLVTQHGGTYVKQLERPVKVTHLLCSGDEETEKMRYAEKFNQRKEASIHLVWEEWFWDSLEFGGRFDESTYQVNRPRPERKIHIENPSSPPPSSTLPSENSESLIQSGVLADQRASLSLQEDDEETTSVKVLPAVTLQIWGSLLHRRGYQISGTELVRTVSAPAVFNSMEEESALEPLVKPGESIITAFRRVKSFAPVQATLDENDSPTRQPFKRASTSANVFHKSEVPFQQILKNGECSSAVGAPVAGPSSHAMTVNKMFTGLRFCMLGEAKTPAVKEAIESHGGCLTDKFEEKVDYIIVRLVSGSKLFREEADQLLRNKYRTECWLERCIFEDRVCSPDQDITFTPLPIETPVLGAENIIMSLSGFDQSESCGLRRLLRALGVTLANSFSRQTTHLLCPSGTGLKFQKACEWRIPVVKVSWLASMVTSGFTPAVQDHLVPGSAICSDPRHDASIELDIKGKGKAKAVPQDIQIDATSKIADITNTDVSGLPDDHPHRSAAEAKRPRTKLVNQTSLSSSSLSFGQPKAYLGESAPVKGPSMASLPPGSTNANTPSSPVPQRKPVPQENLILNSSNPNSQPHNFPKPSWQEIEKERLTTRIPSSRTPSPMKVPTEGGAGNRLSSSPVKFDHEATRALQESITRALKRHTSEEDEILGDGRNPKRLRKRLQRHSKQVPSRQTSDKQILEVPSDLNIIPLMPFAASSTSPFDSFDDPDHDLGEQMIPRINEESEDILGTSSKVNMRVLYEDPGQADERKKLMNLLKTQSQSNDRVSQDTGETRRRSTRTRKTIKTDGC